ncbi:MAG: hypothetical protein VYA55_15230 [Pseudomonadota bacterium]|nr:hypothetical protein [Pseudomonadota bacterium]
MELVRRRGIRPLMGLAVASMIGLIVACGATLIPVWIADLGESQHYNYLYSADDGETTYLVSVGYWAGRLLVTKLDDDGQITGEWELVSSELDRYTGGRLIPLGQDRAMLVGPQPNQLLLLDPAADRIELGLKGLQLAADERLRIHNAHLTDEGNLVFNGTLFTGESGEEVRAAASGSFDQERNLLEMYVNRDLSGRSPLYDAEHNRYVAALEVEVGEEGEEEVHTVLQILDQQLVVQSQQVLPHWFRPVTIIHGFVLGATGTVQGLAIALDGSATYPANIDYSADRFPVADGYYEVSTGYNNGTVVDACFYDRQFVQQWCRQAAPPNRRLYLRAPRLTERGELAFTTDTRAERVMGVVLSAEELTNALQAGVQVRGEVRQTVTHYVYNQSGRQVIRFTEPEYFYRGPMRFCSILDFCIEAEDITPGVCSASTALYRRDNQMISAAGYCDDDSGNWDRRVSLWQW